MKNNGGKDIMGYLGKALLGAAIGVGTVAAIPVTGGGSVLAGTSLIASLTGAGAIASAAGVGGAVTGAVVQGVENIKKEKDIKKAKSASFQDGMNEGKAKTVDELKKEIDFFLATTALSYYIAKCDGEISEEEQLEIDFDLDAIKKNADIPDAIKREMDRIARNNYLRFDDVEIYLDKISIENLQGLENDVQEIIEANGHISEEEEFAKNLFLNYIEQRKRCENYE